MSYEALCYLLIAWLQLIGFVDCFSKDIFDRFAGFFQLVIASGLLFSVEWLIK